MELFLEPEAAGTGAARELPLLLLPPARYPMGAAKLGWEWVLPAESPPPLAGWQPLAAEPPPAPEGWRRETEVELGEMLGLQPADLGCWPDAKEEAGAGGDSGEGPPPPPSRAGLGELVDMGGGATPVGEEQENKFQPSISLPPSDIRPPSLQLEGDKLSEKG